MQRLVPAFLLVLTLGACAANDIDPRLATRSAEAIDPRIPVGSTEPAPGSLTVADELARVETRLADGRRAFAAALPDARTAATRAGAAGSESWVSAQEAVSLLVRAREEVARALADLDALATGPIAREGWASPANREAIARIRGEAVRLDTIQAQTITELQALIAS